MMRVTYRQIHAAAIADAIEGAIHVVDCTEAAEALAKLADQWRLEIAQTPASDATRPPDATETPDARVGTSEGRTEPQSDARGMDNQGEELDRLRAEVARVEALADGWAKQAADWVTESPLDEDVLSDARDSVRCALAIRAALDGTE
jgi:hypothetical protein